MGWFDEQIRQRKLKDQEVFEDSFVRIASVVIGDATARKLQNERLLTRDALDDILKYYRCKPVEIPESIENADEQLEYALRPYGIMRRNVDLEEGWYKDAYGPMLGFTKEDNSPVALLPKDIRGYYYYDLKTGKKTSVTSATAKQFAREAVCFYRPLPLKKLGIPDLLIYINSCISKGDIILVLVASLIATLFGLLSPRITRLLAGPVLNSGSLKVLAGVAVFLVMTTITNQLIMSVKDMIMGRISTKTSLAVEAAVMMRVLTLPANFFREFSAGELANRAGSVNSLCDMMIGSMFSIGLSSLFSLMYVTSIFQFAPVLVIPSLIIIAVTVAFSIITSLMQIRISRKAMQLAAAENGLNYAMISGVQKIKLSGSEKRIFSKWAKLYAEEAQLAYNPPMFIKLNSVIMTGITLVSTIVLYYLAVVSGVGTADYLAFNAAYGQLMGAFSSLAGIALSIAQIRPVLEMAEPILKTEPEVSEGKEVLTRITGNIEMNHVSFRYRDSMPYVIDDMSVKIKAGEYIAIVGKTGCGKSTLMRLLLGFEKPERGSLFFDGKDMNNIDLKSLRRKIGVVTQDGALFQGDIYSNIVISAPQLTLQEAWDAAEIAGIADDIRKMPMGMNTMIAEGQGGISGGQKQRLMIARAVAPKPKVLMFDEATSALDNKTQKQVSEALDNLKCTRIVIAHRLSTIKNCDRILVLDGGKIIEDGTYDELIERNGFFAELVERQRLDDENN